MPTITKKVLGAVTPGKEYSNVLKFHNITFDDDGTGLKLADVLIEISYSDVNPVDLQKLSNFKVPSSKETDTDPSPNYVPGFGGAGKVLKGGCDVPSNLLGKRVCFLCDPSRPLEGSYATHCIVDHRQVAVLPNVDTNIVSERDAATVPVAGLTAYESLVKIGLLHPSDWGWRSDGSETDEGQRRRIISLPADRQSPKTLLVVGGAGGVGSWAIALARAKYPIDKSSLTIIATCTSQQQKDWCLSLGANQTIQHNEIATKLEGGRNGSIDYILCLTEPTPTLWETMANVIKPYGQICTVVSGQSIQSLDLSFCFFKSVSVHTQTVFSSIRTQYKHIVPSQELQTILKLVADRLIPKVPISPDIVEKKISIEFEYALQENGVLEAIANPTHGCRRGNYVLQIY